jgi:hypothetical protein
MNSAWAKFGSRLGTVSLAGLWRTRSRCSHRARDLLDGTAMGGDIVVPMAHRRRHEHDGSQVKALGKVRAVGSHRASGVTKSAA